MQVAQVGSVSGAEIGGVGVHRTARLVAGTAGVFCLAVAPMAVIEAGPASASYPPIPAGPITFGISLPLSGATAAYGTEAEASYKVVEQEFDARYPDGIAGHAVKFDIQNDQSTVTGAVLAARQMISNKDAAVLAITFNPQGAPQQLHSLNAAKVPTFSCVSPDGLETTTQEPYYFGMCASTPELGNVAGHWLASHPDLDKIGVLTDGVASDTQFADAVTAGAKKYDPHAKVVTTQTIAPGAVEVSPQISALRAAGANLVVGAIGYGYGPIWQSMQTAGWSPDVLTSAGAWYDGFTAMGSLAAKAVVPYVDCLKPGQSLPAATSTLLTKFATAAPEQINYLNVVQGLYGPLEILAKAIGKEHSTAGPAIKAGIDSLGRQQYQGGWTYDFTAKNHYGLTGSYAAQVCAMSPLSNGTLQIPTAAP
jgi:ABC-type branched-subunit amino acid transport system substrate-binding protein